MVEVKCKLEDGALVPHKQTEGAAGADIYALLKGQDPVVIPPGKVAVIPTGNFWEIPVGYEVQIRPRSGLAARNSVTVLNTPGTIDSDYRGEVKVILVNFGSEDFIVNDGDRIAQAVVSPVPEFSFIETKEELTDTGRGEGGFGHTGVGVQNS